MKRMIRAFCMCQSMFCAIPFPVRIWDEQARPLMLPILPFIGLEIGALWMGLGWLCRALCVPDMVRGVLMLALPYLLSGFIHLDGFMDVADAVGSCRDPERRREILKDPHVGSFAVIGCVLILLGGFAFHVTARGDFRVLLFVPVVSRCCSALAVMCLRPMKTSQYAGSGNTAANQIFTAVLLALACAGGFLLFGKYGFALLAEAAVYALALTHARTSLGGMNGDISGYGLTLAELAAVAVYALI